MPYRKSNYRKRGYKKRNPKSNAMRAIARQECKKTLAKEIETKNFYGRLNPIAVTFNGIVQPILYNPATAAWLIQGTSKDQFVGDTIKPAGLYINYTCLTTTVTAGITPQFRVVLLQVKGGGTPSAINVLQSVGNMMTPHSYFDPNYQETFNVLYSKIHSTQTNERMLVQGKIIIPAKRLAKVNMLSTSAQNVTAGGIFLVVYSDQSTGSSVAQFGYQSRLAFKDA